jgi:hypothetical protein
VASRHYLDGLNGAEGTRSRRENLDADRYRNDRHRGDNGDGKDNAETPD